MSKIQETLHSIYSYRGRFGFFDWIGRFCWMALWYGLLKNGRPGFYRRGRPISLGGDTEWTNDIWLWEVWTTLEIMIVCIVLSITCVFVSL